ncbi:MAG: class I SAM-dependent methyltransferase [Pseudobdellovibrio sp.]
MAFFTEDTSLTNQEKKTWLKHLSHLKSRPHVTYLEVGVQEGRSLIWARENILPENCEIHVVDQFYNKLWRTNFFANASSLIDKKILELTEEKSETALIKMPKLFYDLVYIDAGHTYREVWNDAILAWPLLKKNAVIVFDDYLWKKFELTQANRPEKALDDFMAAAYGSFELIRIKTQVYLRKTGELPEHLKVISQESEQIPVGGVILPFPIAFILHFFLCFIAGI